MKKLILSTSAVLMSTSLMSTDVSAKTNEADTMNRAIRAVEKHTKKSDSKAVKLKKMYNWLMPFPYKMYRSFNKSYHQNKKSWVATYADDIFIRKGGDCHSTAAALAYIAVAIGYKNVYVGTDAVPAKHVESHSFTLINNRVYDNLFSEAKNYKKYYNSSLKAYYCHKPIKAKVPYSTLKTEQVLIKKGISDGLVKVKGHLYYYKKGKPITNKWQTIKQKEYYFTKNGTAATYSTKIGNNYYIFNKNGVLKQGKKTTIKLKGGLYAVNKNGKAIKGLFGSRYFDDDGSQVTKTDFIDDQFVCINAQGLYDAKLSEETNALAKRGAPVDALIAKLGAYKKRTSEPSCNVGYVNDVIYEYDHFNVAASSRDDGVEYYFNAVSTKER